MSWLFQGRAGRRPSLAAMAVWGSYVLSAVGATAETNAAEDARMQFPEMEWTTVSPETQGLEADGVEAAMAHVASVVGTVGVARTMVVRHGVVVWAGSDMDSLQPVYSCTKSFMSLCLGLLWDDGKCAPDDLASRYWPALREHYPSVTLRHLATFTSGYDCREPNAWEPASPMYAPGAAFHYSRQSDLLALALTRAGKEPLRTLFQRRIGDPIGLTERDWRWNVLGDDDGLAVHGGSGFPESGVHISARGFARLGWLMANHGVWNGKQLVSTNYIATASRPQVPPTVPPHDPAAWYVDLPGSYGLNWWVNGVGAKGERMWPHAPADTFAAQGNKNSVCFVIPSWKMCVVRLGPDVIIDMHLYDRMFELLAGALRKP